MVCTHVRLYCECYLDMINQSGNFTKNRFLRANLRKILIFSGNFMQNFDFSWQISEKYRFSRQKLAIYSYFWHGRSLSGARGAKPPMEPEQWKKYLLVIENNK